jgi:hypothetical protein
LAAGGFSPSAVHDTRHHLRPLEHPLAGSVEVHVAIPGVRVGRDRSSVVEDLHRAGLVEPMPGFAGLLVPTTAILAAHAIAHGIGQHGMSPHAYPLLRMVGDLLDLSRGARSAPSIAESERFLAEV